MHQFKVRTGNFLNSSVLYFFVRTVKVGTVRKFLEPEALI